jgi:putative FmdB family regulatory protein
MPIYEYSCHACGHRFEEWVRKPGMSAPCPECGARDPERLMSPPTVHSEASHESSVKAAKRRERAIGKEQAHAQRQYELSHED